MKKIVLSACLFSFLMSCVSSQKSIKRDPQSDVPVKKEYANVYLQKLIPKINESLAWRTESQELDKKIKESIKNDIPMKSEDTTKFFDIAHRYLQLRIELFEIANKFRYLVAENAKSKISLGRASSVTANKNVIYVLNPKDEYGRDTLFGLRISLAAALILYDNFLVGINPHYENPKARAKLKFDTKKEYNDKFDEVTKSFLDPDQRKRLARAMNLFTTDYNLKAQYKIEISDYEAQLNSLILESAFYNFLQKDGDLADPWSERWDRQVRKVADLGRYTARASTFAISFLFGNIAGAVKTENRDGYLTKLSTAEKNNIKSKLQPFDILLEKTPFRATDKFIPGYYGHVAVYLGTKEQLVAEDLWELFNPDLQKQIEKGETILEALRFDARKGLSKDALAGVQLNSLQHFLDIDELLVIRSAQPLTAEQKNMYAVNANAQYGKPYDFNFDVNTNERIVCSELIYTIFTDLQWPTNKTAGRHTISPDHVMIQAFPNKPLKPILMYDKNRELKEPSATMDLANELYRNIQGDYGNIVYKEESLYRQSKEPQEVIHLASGIASFQQRLEMIRNAKNSIELEYFIYNDDTDQAARILSQALIKKASENSERDPSKKILVRILIDASATVLKIKDEYASVLKSKNIQVRYYNNAESLVTNFMKANQRNHRKSIIVDGLHAITGGRNIGSEYFDLSPTYNFLDTDIYIKGSMALALLDSFEAYWNSPLSAEPNFIVPRSGKEKDRQEYLKKMEKAYRLITETPSDRKYAKLIETWGARLLATQFKTTCNESTFVSDFPSDTLDSRRTFETIKKVALSAKKSLDIESPYFVVTDKGNQIFKKLLANPEFKMSVQTNSLQSTDATYTVADLQPRVKKLTSVGVDMWMYSGDAPNPAYMDYPDLAKSAVWGVHSKRAVVDGHTTLIGTYNVDPRSTNLNNEMVFICHNNPELAQNVLEDMNHRREQSVKLGANGLPTDGSDRFQGASNGKIAQYYFFKRLTKIPAFRDLL